MASRTELSVLTFVALASSHVLAGDPSSVPGPDFEMENEPSGEKYDFEKTGKPERPWEYPYHRMCVTKLNTSGLNVAQLAEIIRMFDNVTLGIKKVIYMSGMGFRYPSWETLGDHFRRPQDKTSLEAVRWLMKEAREKHNTLLSVHINMLDAMYQDTELYRTYLKYDIIHKQKDGTEWTMPESWENVTKADILEVTTEGLKKLADTPVEELKMTVQLKMEKKRLCVAIPRK